MSGKFPFATLDFRLHDIDLYLEQAGAIESNSNPLSDNLGGIDKVIEDTVVDSEKGTGPGPLLLQLVGLPRGFGKDSPLSNEDHMLAAELLLELSHKPKVINLFYLSYH